MKTKMRIIVGSLLDMKADIFCHLIIGDPQETLQMGQNMAGSICVDFPSGGKGGHG